MDDGVVLEHDVLVNGVHDLREIHPLRVQHDVVGDSDVADGSWILGRVESWLSGALAGHEQSDRVHAEVVMHLHILYDLSLRAEEHGVHDDLGAAPLVSAESLVHAVSTGDSIMAHSMWLPAKMTMPSAPPELLTSPVSPVLTVRSWM